MRDILLSIKGKQLKKLLRNKDFVFCIVAYPVALLLYVILRVYIPEPESEETGTYYTLVSILILGFVATVSIFERIEKRALHKVQGDKLKIKQKDISWKN
jgi:Na+/melibiose symporter-like transporter